MAATALVLLLASCGDRSLHPVEVNTPDGPAHCLVRRDGLGRVKVALCKGYGNGGVAP